MPYKHSKYLRVRVRKPSEFRPGSFRTQDIGRKGHTKRITGKLKSTGKWATQNFLIRKEDIAALKTKRLMTGIRKLYPKATVLRGRQK